MKKFLIFLIMVFITGCSGTLTNGSKELTIEQVQQYAQQTMTAQAGGSQDNGQMLIRPVLQQPTATPPGGSGMIILATPDDTGTITRPVYNMPTAIPTAANPPMYPIYSQPTSSTNYAQPVTTVCERVRFVDDVTIPDNTVMAPGQTFRKTWRIQNAGSCAWNSGYQLVYSGGDAMGTNYAVNLPGTVAPGATVDISIDLVAPMTYGTYQSKWKLRSPSGNLFGTANAQDDSIWVKIIVGTNANMATIAPGITPVNTGCTLLSVTPPHRAAFHPGEETDFYFRVRNDTYMVWTASDLDIAYIGGENMLKRKEQVRKDLMYDVAPGGTLEYGLDAIVPNTPGTYTMTMGVVRGYEVLCSMDVTITVVY